MSVGAANAAVAKAHTSVLTKVIGYVGCSAADVVVVVVVMM